ncbi:MAG: hypothetical protein AAGC88_09615, partial [Bacteroidota bacterium]
QAERFYNTLDVRFHTTLGTGFGQGRITYQSPYDYELDDNGNLFLDDNGQPFTSISEYSITINASFRLGVGASIEYKRFQIGLIGGIEAYQLGQAVLQERFIRSRFSYRYDTNTGEWPSTILHYGTFIAYNIPVGELFILGPKAGIGSFSYINTEPFEEGNLNDVPELFTDRFQYNLGVFMKVQLNDKTNLSVTVTRMINEFDASDFLNIAPPTFSQTFKQTFIEFGYSYSLFNK